MQQLKRWLQCVGLRQAGLLCGLSGCIAGGSHEHALYSRAEGSLPAEQTARLTGYVRSVDGQDVSAYGGSFTLLPGCHVIVTATEWGSATPNSAESSSAGDPTAEFSPATSSDDLLKCRAEFEDSAAQ